MASAATRFARLRCSSPIANINAGGQPHQIERVGSRPCFVQIIHAPDEASFFIPPRPEVFDVQIAHTQYGRGLYQIGESSGQSLQPAIEGGAEKRKCGLRHVLMLEREILANDRQLPCQPVLEIGRGFEDIHAELRGFLVGLNMRVFGSRWTAAQTRLIDGESRGEFRHLFAYALLDLGVADVRENFRDPAADLLHLRSRMPRVVTEGLPKRIPPPFIGGRGSKGIEFLLTVMPARSRAFSASVPVMPRECTSIRKQMVVRAARHDAKPELGDGRGHGFRVGHYLLLIFLEGRLHGFFQADCFCGDGVDQRTALRPGNVSLSSSLANAALHRTKPPRGPRNVFVRRR